MEKEKLSPHLEDYLETISALSKNDQIARTTDIANTLNVKKPSVTAALNALSKKGFVDYQKYKPVTLTKKGDAIANQISKKHELLKTFFTDILDIAPEESEVAACKMEHSLGDSMMQKLVSFIKNLHGCTNCTQCEHSCVNACPNIVALSTLKKGQSGIVVEIDKKLGNASHYAGMGLSLGAKVAVLRKAPLGDPFVLEIRGTKLSMRKDELDLIKIKKV